MSRHTSRRSLLDESHVLSSRHRLVSARNEVLVLSTPDGPERAYTDLMSAYGAVNFGHANPDITASADEPADLAGCFYPPEADEVADWLCARLNLPRHRVLFQVGGSFAVSTALALARRARAGRILAMEGSFHGLGQDTLAVTGIQHALALQAGPGVTRLGEDVDFLKPGSPPPDWSLYSCLLFEPVQGANGYVPLERAWLADLAAGAREAGVIVVADEVQSGFHRHGPLSVARAWGLTPDVLLFGKSLTNGLYPLSAVVHDEALEGPHTDPGVRLAHTFQTGVPGYRAAAAVTRWLDSTPVADLAAGVHRALRDAADRLSPLPEVRGVHLTGPTLSFEVLGGRGPRAVRRAFEDGVVAFVGGPASERVRVAPPLTIPPARLEAALAVLVAAVKATTGPTTGPTTDPTR
ncbi:aminotransferase class III-fold pyridoxal phosphate-dependent enzyme (plasmid) [Streptomyces sp. BI20]|uniref:aminotransferase class III-fold pyridoxal phosphate-dependent enzyme n=1 Tax=Streptomyces sp. BI20 TaxID=3403460 RepID=UPI003C737080